MADARSIRSAKVAPHLDLMQETMRLHAEELDFTEGIEAVKGAAALLLSKSTEKSPLCGG